MDFGNTGCVGPLIQTLAKMKKVFAESVILTNTGSTKLGVPQPVAVSYSNGEEFWIQTRLESFKQVSVELFFSSSLTFRCKKTSHFIFFVTN